MRLSRSEQTELCLSAAHAGCPRYRAFAAARESLAGDSVLGDYVATRLVLGDRPSPTGFIATRLAGQRRRTLAPLIVAVVLLSLVGVSVVSGAAGALGTMLSRPGDLAPIEVSATPSVERGNPLRPPRATLPPAGTPSPMPALSPSRSPSPSPAPTAAPATPQPAVTYVVQLGDTLHAIAVAHGTSVDALVAENGLQSANVIVVGQRLAIPQSGG